MKTTHKGQAALEFLTTYGWAFLVILVMIGALSYFGVLDPSRFLPDKCIFGTGVGACADAVASNSGNQVQATIINSLGQDIKIQGITIAAQGISGVCATPCVAGTTPAYCGMPDPNTPWLNNEKRTLTINCSAAAPFTGIVQGDKPKVHVNMSYIAVGGTFVHTLEGDIQVKLAP